MWLSCFHPTAFTHQQGMERSNLCTSAASGAWVFLHQKRNTMGPFWNVICTCCYSDLSSIMHASHTGFCIRCEIPPQTQGVLKIRPGNCCWDALQRAPANSSLHTQWKSGTFLKTAATDDGFRSFEVVIQQGSVCEGGATRRSHCMSVVLMTIWQLSALCFGKINVTAPIWLSGLTLQAHSDVPWNSETCTPQYLFFFCGDLPPFHSFLFIDK